MCSVTMSSPLLVDIVGMEKNSTSLTSGGDHKWEALSQNRVDLKFQAPHPWSKETEDCRRWASTVPKLPGKSTCTVFTSPPGSPPAERKRSFSARSRDGKTGTQYVEAFLSVSP